MADRAIYFRRPLNWSSIRFGDDIPAPMPPPSVWTAEEKLKSLGLDARFHDVTLVWLNEYYGLHVMGRFDCACGRQELFSLYPPVYDVDDDSLKRIVDLLNEGLEQHEQQFRMLEKIGLIMVLPIDRIMGDKPQGF